MKQSVVSDTEVAGHALITQAHERIEVVEVGTQQNSPACSLPRHWLAVSISSSPRAERSPKLPKQSASSRPGTRILMRLQEND
jgi:hypothetical protein